MSSLASEKVNSSTGSNSNNNDFVTIAKLIEISQFVYDKYYKNAYEKKPPPEFAQELKEKWRSDLDADQGVERPNHALAHSMRKAFVVPIIVETFHKHSKHMDTFKFSPEEIFALQVALLFESVGRKSDISYADCPILHNEYDQTSYKIFKSYFEKKIPNDLHRVFNNASVALESMYSTEKMPHTIILEIAHSVDLSRCYTSEQMKSKFRKTLLLYFDPVSKPYVLRMYKYGVKLIHATGDRLLYDFDAIDSRPHRDPIIFPKYVMEQAFARIMIY